MSKVTLEDVREFIRHADAEELRLLNGIINSRYKHLNAELSLDFKRGDEVYFWKGKRSPTRISGVVVHTDTKWVYLAVPGRAVNMGGWNWKVSATLLKRKGE